MAIENLHIIDVVSIDKEGNAVLTVADHLEWDMENTHLLMLQNKLNAYLDAIQNGSLYKSYPNAANRRIIINVCMKYLPNRDGKAFLESTNKSLEAMGYSFLYNKI